MVNNFIEQILNQPNNALLDINITEPAIIHYQVTLCFYNFSKKQ